MPATMSPSPETLMLAETTPIFSEVLPTADSDLKNLFT
jgi:hypothetical protein